MHHLLSQQLSSQTNLTNLNQVKNQSQQTSQKQSKIQQLRKWMTEKGCIIHPHVQIPSFINGYQGVGTKALIPPKTVVIAVPSSLILTVTKCYKDPQLKSIFTKNDDLFDYEESDDCEFNVLCVFLMYHKLNIDNSPWKIYLQTIGEPQTAIDWPDRMLKGLNKSAIQQILHVRIQCDKLRDQLSEYLKTTKQFAKYPLEQIKQCFNFCYRAVMTRCFGYYFGQSALIPIADLINHGCEAVDHQLINIRYEKNQQFCEGYKQKSQKIDCQLLGIKRGKHVMPPFRERFLLMNNLIESDLQTLAGLDHQKIDSIIAKYNEKMFRQESTVDVTKLQFCEQDDSEDNDTDIDEQTQRELQLERMQLEELQQIQNFKKYASSVKVETYKQVQDRFEKYEQQLGASTNRSSNTIDLIDSNQLGTNNNDKQYHIPLTQSGPSRNDLLIQGFTADKLEQPQTSASAKHSTNKKHENQENNENQENQEDWEDIDDSQKNPPQCITNQTHKIGKITTSTITSTPPQNIKPSHISESLFFEDKNQSKPPEQKSSTIRNPKAIVPVQMVESSQSQSQDDEQWGLEPDSYFTLSTSSAVGPNKQLFNSYDSRTNKFLLIWYGFCYRNNLFDSVSLRLHVQFHKTLPKAQTIVLDTYVGGQGRSFRKNESQLVKANEVSRQFRFKRNKICTKLLTFLRLYLLDYYKGGDLYKICVTLPSSIDFEIFALSYYRQIVLALYERYPTSTINELLQELQSKQTRQQDRQKIKFKIIYLEEQRKIIDDNLETLDCLMNVWYRIQQRKINIEKLNGSLSTSQFDKSLYEDLTIYQLRKLKPYLSSLKNNYSYVLYQQSQQSQIIHP